MNENDSPIYSKRISIFLLSRYPHGRFISISFIKDAILGFEVDLSCSDKAGTFCAFLVPGSDPRSVHLMWIMVYDGKRMRTRTQKTTMRNDSKTRYKDFGEIMLVVVFSMALCSLDSKRLVRTRFARSFLYRYVYRKLSNITWLSNTIHIVI